MYLSVVIPIYNEKKFLVSRLSQILSFLENRFKGRFEVLLVDDGSDDETAQEVLRFLQSSHFPSVYLLRNEQNCGKGYSVARGILKSQGGFVFFTDSDLATPLSFIPLFLERLERDADIVIASRFEKGSQILRRRSLLLTFLSWSERRLIRLLAGIRFSDTQCGFKGFRGPAARELFARIRVRRFCFDVEILFLAKRLGFKIETYPVSWSHDKDSKVGWKDLFIFVWDLLRIRWCAWRGIYSR